MSILLPKPNSDECSTGVTEILFLICKLVLTQFGTQKTVLATLLISQKIWIKTKMGCIRKTVEYKCISFKILSCMIYLLRYDLEIKFFD